MSFVSSFIGWLGTTCLSWIRWYFSAPLSDKELPNIDEDKSSLEGVEPSSASEESCPVCYEHITRKAVLQPCQHTFCYNCIMTWSAQKLECPLCKTKFELLYYDIVSDTDYKERRFSDASSGNDELSEEPGNIYPPFEFLNSAGASSYGRVSVSHTMPSYVSSFVSTVSSLIEGTVNLTSHNLGGASGRSVVSNIGVSGDVEQTDDDFEFSFEDTTSAVGGVATTTNNHHTHYTQVDRDATVTVGGLGTGSSVRISRVGAGSYVNINGVGTGARVTVDNIQQNSNIQISNIGTGGKVFVRGIDAAQVAVRCVGTGASVYVDLVSRGSTISVNNLMTGAAAKVRNIDSDQDITIQNVPTGRTVRRGNR